MTGFGPAPKVLRRELASFCSNSRRSSSLQNLTPPPDLPLPAPRITILSASSGNGRRSAFASSQGARIQTSGSSSAVRITGIAFGWIGLAMAFLSSA
jgi:hypothetical protein